MVCNVLAPIEKVGFQIWGVAGGWPGRGSVRVWLGKKRDGRHISLMESGTKRLEHADVFATVH